MATDWLPVTTILVEDFKKNLPSFLKEVKNENPNSEALVYTDGISFIYVYMTHIKGVLLSQYNKNQIHPEMLENIGKHFGTKFISYVGEPYDGHNYDFNELWKREYPDDRTTS